MCSTLVYVVELPILFNWLSHITPEIVTPNRDAGSSVWSGVWTWGCLEVCVHSQRVLEGHGGEQFIRYEPP